ncbi:MAG: DUF4139 domain-containing protein [Trichloromonadaceae bacterium]
MRPFSRLCSCLLGLSLCLPFTALCAPTEERRSTLEDQQEVAVTIYNQDLALVRDQRRVTLDTGENILALREVSAALRPETALLKNLSHPKGFAVREQNFDYDLLSPQKLLEKYVGRTVQVVRSHPQTGVETLVDAEVLAANNGIVLRLGDHIETGIPGRIVYPDVPANLRDRPTLVVQLESGASASQLLELSYLTGGLSWQADYVAELNAADDRLDLSGWITLANQSGTSYRNAKLQLVAGDVHRVRDELGQRQDLVAKEMMVRAAAPQIQQESLFEYHLYTLARPTTLAENQTKQVALLGAGDVPVRKEYLLAGQDYYYRGHYGQLEEKRKIAVFIEFANREQAGLGLPLPKGVVRVYKKDLAGNAQFVGEDRIDHTPKNAQLRLYLGDAFDVTASRKQTDFKQLGSREQPLYETAFEIVLNNARSDAVTVQVQEPLPGDWEILRESHPHAKQSANSALWQIKVPAEGSATLSYRLRIKN